jgi:hypothetical protein
MRADLMPSVSEEPDSAKKRIEELQKMVSAGVLQEVGFDTEQANIVSLVAEGKLVSGYP